MNMIGGVLKYTRNIYGYKAKEMSSALCISASYISEIENNKKQPSLELLKKICRYLWDSFVIANFAFRKYGRCRKVRKEYDFY